MRVVILGSEFFDISMLIGHIGRFMGRMDDAGVKRAVNFRSLR